MLKEYFQRWRWSRVTRLKKKRDGVDRCLQQLYREKLELLQVIQQHKDSRPGFFEYAFDGAKLAAGIGVSVAGVAAAVVAHEVVGELIPGGDGLIGQAISHKVGDEVVHHSVAAGGGILASRKTNAFDYGPMLRNLEKKLLLIESSTTNAQAQLARVQSKISRVERRCIPQSVES